MSNTIDLEDDGLLSSITVDNTANQNSLDLKLLGEFSEKINDADETKPIMISGAGEDTFIAGADIDYMSNLDSQAANEMASMGHKVCNLLESFPAPVIAAINGHAYGGGCEIALAADIRIASSNAIIGQPEISLGIIPGWGGTQRLSRVVGDEKARRMVFLSQRLSADEALDCGLVGEVVPQDELYNRVLSMAEDLSQFSNETLAAAKEALNQVHETPLRAGLIYEKRSWASLFGEYNQREGMEAFLEKREPEFK